ncbi:hypothetical protein WJX72_003320 [[Myrmecia] bisecta]|uniref:protein-tyrosine-phosphatase n=1 Tax=[Myrmecia] bisecta TaxID=41462 RepID=A0AAW1Q1E9_9CHLO
MIQVDFATGFPVPLYYGQSGPRRTPRTRQPLEENQLAERLEAVKAGAGEEMDLAQDVQSLLAFRGAVARIMPQWLDEREPDVQPVFRASPYTAEKERELSGRTTTRILFLDEGNLCRSVLAEAVFRQCLENSAQPLDIEVESASVGPALSGEHDARVEVAAREFGLQLAPRQARIFDELVDIVNFDLVLVMDHFDFTEVLREVAVFDKINPGGFYSLRVKLLGTYVSAARSFSALDSPFADSNDINDPLYGNAWSERELAALRVTIQHIQAACEGLLEHLVQLEQRCVAGLPLQVAMAQAVQCPLLESTDSTGAWPRSQPEAARRPVWREPGPAESGTSEFFSIRVNNGQRSIVRRSMGQRVKRGYWKKLENVEKELKAWLKEHKVKGRMPTQRELRKSGANMLSVAISKHGGLVGLRERLRLDRTRRRKGYWSDLSALERELRPYLTCIPEAGLRASATRYVMPQQAELLAAGRSDLMKAIRAWGGSVEVANLLGISPRQGAVSTIDQVCAELKAYMEETGIWADGCLPSRAQLQQDGHSPLVNAITRLGGVRRFAAIMRMDYVHGNSRLSPGKLADVHMLPKLGPMGSDALLDAAFESNDAMPEALLSSADGRPSDNEDALSAEALCYADWDGLFTCTDTAVSYPVTAGDIGSSLQDGPPSAEASRWGEELTVMVDRRARTAPLMDQVGQEVLRYLHSQGITEMRIPTRGELQQSGRIDLAGAIQRCGGGKRLARFMGVAFKETRGRKKAEPASIAIDDDTFVFI